MSRPQQHLASQLRLAPDPSRQPTIGRNYPVDTGVPGSFAGEQLFSKCHLDGMALPYPPDAGLLLEGLLWTQPCVAAGGFGMRFRTWPVAALGLVSLLGLIAASMLTTSRRAQEIYSQLDQLNTRHHDADTKLRRLR